MQMDIFYSYACRDSYLVFAWLKLVEKSGQALNINWFHLQFKWKIHNLITVCDDADKNCPTIWPSISTRLHWSFEDPSKFEGTHDEKLAKFREIRDLIEKKIGSWLSVI